MCGMQWSTQTVSSSLENFGFRDEEAEDTTQEVSIFCIHVVKKYQTTRCNSNDVKYTKFYFLIFSERLRL